MYGFGVEGQGFYLLEGGSDEEEQLTANAASFVVTEGEATEDSVRLDLADMWESEWDSQVTMIRKNCFSVIYPFKLALWIAQKSGTVMLPISGHKAEVGEPFSDPFEVSRLQECWVRVTGIPNHLRQAPLIQEFLRVVDKAAVEDMFGQ
ncbi:hypothetical protein ZWY2020_020355 [Hordeum vulgare]|nr:hypothetical protein ZWY2020_020355 [Hordeum vulgare]